jgi:hypothetical protein
MRTVIVESADRCDRCGMRFRFRRYLEPELVRNSTFDYLGTTIKTVEAEMDYSLQKHICEVKP